MLEEFYNENLYVLLRVFFLILCRFGTIVTLSPFLGNKLPNVGKIALAISLALIFTPNAIITITNLSISTSAFTFLVVKEIFLGYAIGILFAAPFFIASAAGTYIDYARGSSMLISLDPTLQVQASTVGIFLNFYYMMIFFQMDGLLIFSKILADSLVLVPVDLYPTIPTTLDSFFWNTMITTIGHIFEFSIILASPVLLSILMTEAFLGIANRLAPQVQIAFLGMSLKSLVGLSFLFLSWTIILKTGKTEIFDWLNKIEEMILHLGPNG